MTMLERAAKASYEAGGDAGVRMPPWDVIPADSPLKVNRLRDVRAALEALMEPDEGVMLAGSEAVDTLFDPGARAVWQAMLREVLKEGGS